VLGLAGAYAALSAGRWQGIAVGLAGASVLICLLGLWKRRPAGILSAVLLAGAAYGLSVAGRDTGFDLASILVAALLLVAAELGLWSLELASPVRYEPAILTRRAALVAVLGLGSLCAAAAVGAVAAQEAERSLLLLGLGVAAAVAVSALIARLTRL
jgi:hypothetical protein